MSFDAEATDQFAGGALWLVSVPVFHSSTRLSNSKHTHSHDTPPPPPPTQHPCYFSDSPGKGTCFSCRTLHTKLNNISSHFRLFSCSHVVPSGLSRLDQPFHFTLNSNQQLLSFRASSRLPLSCPACTQQPFLLHATKHYNLLQTLSSSVLSSSSLFSALCAPLRLQQYKICSASELSSCSFTWIM